jgi:hypothetical protein
MAGPSISFMTLIGKQILVWFKTQARQSIIHLTSLDLNIHIFFNKISGAHQKLRGYVDPHAIYDLPYGHEG